MPAWYEKLKKDVAELSKRTGIPEEACYNLLNPDTEYDSVQVIKQYLRTPEQKAWLDAHDLSIEDMLNGRVEGEANQEQVEQIFQEWNAKLGQTMFG